MTATFRFTYSLCLLDANTLIAFYSCYGSSVQDNMALPLIRSIADCTDYTKTILPYTSQLYDLPQQIFDNINNLQALKVLYVSTNPLIFAFAFSLFLFPIFLVVSEINRNYSQVDRCWSILPTIYNAHYTIYAHGTGLSTQRLDVLLLLSTSWSVGTPPQSQHALTDGTRRD